MAADLVTLDEIKQMLSLSSSNVEDDLLLRQLIRVASSAATRHCGRDFMPLWETRYYDALGEHISPYQLNLDAELLTVIKLTNGDGSEIAETDYVLLPYQGMPKMGIRLRPTASAPFTYSDDWLRAISVEGVWGYHDDWNAAWVNSNDALTAPVTATATTFTVNDADNSDASGNAPRFQVLAYYRLDDEVIQVTAVNAVTNTLTVVRGQRGTIAAAHAVDTTLYRYYPQRDVSMAVLSLAAWMYRNRTSLGEKYQFLDGTRLAVNEAPGHIMLILNAYHRLRVG